MSGSTSCSSSNSQRASDEKALVPLPVGARGLLGFTGFRLNVSFVEVSVLVSGDSFRVGDSASLLGEAKGLNDSLLGEAKGLS